MRIPTIRGVIDRRILVNYRVDPDVLASHLPAPFRPQVHNGVGIAGICLIRLKQIRPKPLPDWMGIRSENAAHRFAVEWNHEGENHRGVYIPRRDTSSRLNSIVGGRLFPGRHHHADFQVMENDESYELTMRSDDNELSLKVIGSIATALPASSVFQSLQEASRFFEEGTLGYSDTNQSGMFDGLELRTFGWQVQPLEMRVVESSYFDDPQRFPAESIQFDSALLMQQLHHEWHEQPVLCCQPS